MRILDIQTYIDEKLDIKPIQKSRLNSIPKYTAFPKNKEELKQLIDQRIEVEGVNCNLNNIDVSGITDMSRMFYYSDFNGSISQWDVSNVEDMRFMFAHSKFNGDISRWNVSKVHNMEGMFLNSVFNKDISKWDVSGCEVMRQMFKESEFNGDISKWDVSNVKDMDFMFMFAEKFDQDISGWNVKKVIMYEKERSQMYLLCPLKDHPEKQPKFL